VDRIGQRRRVHEILLVARDTAERLVLAPLARRAARARSALPGASEVLTLLSESRVAAAVMEGAGLTEEQDSTAAAAVSSQATSAEADVEAARLRTIREWNDGTPRPGASPVVGLIRQERPRCGATCLYIVALVGPNGDTQHSEVVAVRDSLALCPTSTGAGAATQAFERWLQSREPEVRHAVSFTAGPGLEKVVARYRASIAALERREQAMCRARPSVSRQLVQAGLFDARAVRAQQVRRQSTEALLEESEARIASLEAALNVTVSVKLAAFLWHYCPDT
jgi:hypothetical protein